jgi:hypothetical protein
MEHENKRDVVEAKQRSSQKQNVHLKADISQLGASSSGIPPRRADSISQPR